MFPNGVCSSCFGHSSEQCALMCGACSGSVDPEYCAHANCTTQLSWPDREWNTQEQAWEFVICNHCLGATSQFCAEQLECMPRRHTSEVVMQGYVRNGLTSAKGPWPDVHQMLTGTSSHAMADDDHRKCIEALPKVAQSFMGRPKVDERTWGELGLPLDQDPVTGKVLSRDSECMHFQRCQNLTHKLAWQAREKALQAHTETPRWSKLSQSSRVRKGMCCKAESCSNEWRTCK